MKEQSIIKSIKISNEILLDSVVDLIEKGSSVKINISGSSMEPCLYEGDTIVIKGIKLAEVKLGDIILGKYKGAYILHRVIKRAKDCIYIAGDNNLSQIEKIEASDIYAIATEVVKLDNKVDLRSNLSRIKGLIWYYLRFFRRVKVKLLKTI